MLSIRTATRNDMALLRTLIQEMAEYEKLPCLITEEALARDGFGTQPAFSSLIAEWDGHPAGYAFFCYSYSTFKGRGLFLEDLFVRAQFRSRRVGDTLLSRVAAIARDQGCFGIVFNVLAWNQPAIRFFQKHHAIFLDDWKTALLDADAVTDLHEAK
jgi:GNAT superfamily N-acetyltransferase